MPLKKKLIKKKKLQPRRKSANFVSVSQHDPGPSKKKSTKRYSGNGLMKGSSNFYSPFNSFANLNITRKTDAKAFSKMPQNYSPQMGLTRKEKSFLIGTCQSSSQYQNLKNIASNAIKNHQIFIIYGNCGAVRKALVERGWVEKIAPHKMNLSRIRNGVFPNKIDVFNELERLLLSNLVEKYPPKLVWQTKETQFETTIDMSTECPAMVNRLKTDAIWTSKQGLCTSMKVNYWFYIENVAEVNSPRTYDSFDTNEIDGFVEDFQITACTSLLKWVLSMVSNDRPIFVKTGKISINVVLFALNRCKDYLFEKQNKDIDRPLHNVSKSQWNVFIRKYYRIIAKDDVFKFDTDNKIPLYLCYAKCLLKEIHKYRPQLSCEGCHNIWIIKPAYCSRGRGIRMASKLYAIMEFLKKASMKYVIQKYIEEPLLIHETKFDIRQYYLVTNTYPLVIWMYQDCYLKFSSQKYNLKKYHESIHLTNNAVQRRYKNCVGRHADLPLNNMWDSARYKEYLNSVGKDKVWDNIIYPGMKKAIIGIMLSCQDSLSVCKNRFELYGCDFILDKEYKPWLIEINSCPDLNSTTPVTAKICPAVISDIIKVVIDFASNSLSSTGKFECIFRQPMTTPKYSSAADLVVQGSALSKDYFYTGNLGIAGLYNPDIRSATDIKSMLKKLKENYETDIMVEPEDDSDITDNYYTKKIAKHIKSPSEDDLSTTASAITSQVDDILEHITSRHSNSSENRLELPSFDFNNAISIAPQNPTTKSETNIKHYLKTPGSRFTSAEALVAKQTFRFSQLDDVPSRKGSVSLYNPIGKVNQLSIIGEEKKNSYTDIMLQATSKIVSFINKKEKEYCRDNLKNQHNKLN